ncbi:hypothetical protein F8O01_08610 [Pseudoclavibacter chungangensis]|uniref:Integral membrane protein n=1 Tax=Pseudoclavibacter chungangensis TaxID=587635 RepID=A0A7J5BSL3_9MICO|nr:hypothetical protein [Pseudoclavibacter chungangensis]KAB1657295.1 hypothetical protein F8O01_08610 [Pseudoclavibacter chungangensis]NYJ66257.1 hypothetical protein [Pseudoclavibacter chungangensis]
MIDWFTWIAAGLAAIVGVVCLVLGLVGRRPSDVSVGAIAVVELLLVVQVVLAIVTPVAGNAPVGDGIEFWAYLVTALIIPPAAVFWGLVEPSKWSTVILGAVGLTVAVMLVRMQQIWTGQPPFLGG